MKELFFHNLQVFTFQQFFLIWGIYSISALFIFGMTDRFVRIMPWLSMWIIMTPPRHPAEDFVWMTCCWMLSELAYFKTTKYIRGVNHGYKRS
jgi:hypothetical protein